MTPIRRLLVSFVLALCAVAVAGEEQWETIETGPILVKNRKRPGTDVKEVWAEGNLDAGVLAIQTALTDISRYTRFMPCVSVAKQIGARHELVESHEIEDPSYQANGSDRCFHCKSELYRVSARMQKEWGRAHVVNGTNVDELGDYRPGLRAVKDQRTQEKNQPTKPNLA